MVTSPDSASDSNSPSRPRREHFIAGVVLAAVVLLMFWKLTIHPTDLLVGSHRDGRNDVTAHNLAARDWLRQALFSEDASTSWMSSGLLGAPWLGNPQSAMFYPPHWIFVFVQAATAMSWLIVAHHWWAALGLYFYVRRLNVSWAGAVLSGVCFAGAPFLMAQTAEGHSTQVFLISWTPWALLIYDGLRRGERGMAPSMAIVLAIAFFAGHVQEVYYLVVILSGFVVCDMVRRDRSQLIKPMRLAWTWCLIGVATAALVAVELAPNWIYTRFGVRSQGIGSEAAGFISAGPDSLWQLLNPFALGGPDLYQGPGDFYWETLCCFGVAPLLLAIVGGMQVAGRDRALRWLVLAVVTLLFAMGGDTPLFPLLHRYVPGMSLFRAPGRALFFTSLSVAVLAGMGWDWLESVARKMRSGGASSGRIPYVLAAVPILVCAIELTFYASRLCATAPATGLRRTSEVVELLKKEDSLGRVLAPQELLSDREALDHGLDKLRRYEPVPLARTLALFNALAPDVDAGQEITGFQTLSIGDYRKPLLDMVNVTHVVLPLADPAAKPEPLEGWELAGQGKLVEELVLRGRKPRTIAFALYRNKSPMPPAFVVGSAAVSNSPARLAELDPRAKVMLPQEVRIDQPSSQSYAAADIVEQSGDHMVVEADLKAPGYLVVSSSFYPGWRVDSGEPIIPGNLALRATPLDAGAHRLTYRYTPPGRFLGVFVSSVGWIVVAYTLLSSMRRRKRRSPTADDAPSTAATDSKPGVPHAAKTVVEH